MDAATGTTSPTFSAAEPHPPAHRRPMGRPEPRAASALLLGSSGALLLVFVGYAALFGRTTRWSVLISLAVACLLLGAGAVLGAFI